MYSNLEIVKGIHPGFIIEHELAKRKLRKSQFAQILHEHPQTLGAILKSKRNLNTALALKIEKELGLEEGYLMILQTFYNIRHEKMKHYQSPDLKKLRPVLFWDTDIHTIQWDTQKRAVIRRVFERGNEAEQLEISRFYSENEVKKILASHD